MKKYCIYIVSAAFVLFSFFMSVYVLSKPAEGKQEKRISFIAAISNQGYWGRAADGALKKGEALGLNVKCFRQTDLDAEKLLTSLEIAVNSHVDGIITYGLNQSEAFFQLQERAAQEGIPLVLIDSDVEGGDRLCYIGTDNYYTGEQAGEVMSEACDGEGKILLVASDRTVRNQMERMQGFEDVLKQYPQLEIVEYLEIGSNRLFAKQKIVRALEENPDIKGIFCAEGVGTGACCQVLQELGKMGPPLCLIGYDYSEAVRGTMENGYITGCIQQDSRRMGELAVEILDQYLNEGKEPQKVVYTDSLMIQKENMEEAEKIHYESVEVQWHHN